MFVLEDGGVTVLKTWQGREYVLQRLGKGDCFGEMSLIDLCPRSATVRAEQDCKAIESTDDGASLVQRPARLYGKEQTRSAVRTPMTPPRKTSNRVCPSSSANLRSENRCSLKSSSTIWFNSRA